MSTGASAGSVGWYWNRLRCMSVPEVAYRLQQKLSAQVQQIGVATAQSVPAPEIRPVSAFMAVDAVVVPDRYVAAADRILAGHLTVFDCEYTYRDVPEWNRDPKSHRVAPLAFGKTLDYRDELQVGDIKYLWEPNRHLHLVTLAQAYRLTADPRYLRGLQRQLDSWFAQCPYLRGPNWTSSLELAIRLINWSLAWQLIGSPPERERQPEWQAFEQRWLQAIYRHQHFIRGHFSRFSSANNHLIGEAAGLYIGATTWPFWRQTPEWRAAARRELLRETLQQNGADGVNREQAISYQQFVFDFQLLAGLAGRKNGDDFPIEYWQRLETMLEFVAALMDVGGNVPMIGDADDGYVTALPQVSEFCPYRSLLATGASLFERGDFKTKAGTFDDKSRWLLGEEGAQTFRRVPATSPASTLPRAFPEGGYYVLGSDFDTAEEVRIVADAGPLGYQRIAAHGHADALAFTLSIGGNEFLIDPGTYAYHTERKWRDYFRGTAAHNTVRIDGADQSVIGGSFLWTQHADVTCESWQPGVDNDRWRGAHTGYCRLTDPVRHKRELVFEKHRRCLRLTDIIECSGRHRVERFWHFAEDVAVQLDDEGRVIAERNGRRLLLTPIDAAVTATLYRGDNARPAGWVSRRFGVKQPTTTVVWQNQISGTVRLSVTLECLLAAPRAEESKEWDFSTNS
ncbi:MAG: alginate lyase family protein [Gammaproteobacteria bacterium]|nr:alginate lyase family protein [Gammaproteobacteria bacterium]